MPGSLTSAWSRYLPAGTSSIRKLPSRRTFVSKVRFEAGVRLACFGRQPLGEPRLAFFAAENHRIRRLRTDPLQGLIVAGEDGAGFDPGGQHEAADHRAAGAAEIHPGRRSGLTVTARA